MKKTGLVVTIIILLAALFLPIKTAFAATDGFYNSTEVLPAVWDGTDADRTKAPVPAPSGSSYPYDYDYTYGDEGSVTYTLPWALTYYGQTYTQITADTNGNVWFDTRITGSNPTLSGSAYSFTLNDTKTTPTSASRGPVVAVWNNDLSSYYYGGVFIQHKTNPERVVIEWQSETYTEESSNALNDFEVVIFPNGNVRADYKSFTTAYGKDFGSGISKGDGTAFLSPNVNVFNLANHSYQFRALPKISPSPGTVDFGNGYVGTASTTQTVTVTNTRYGELTVGTIALAGANPDRFSISSDGCTGHTLPLSGTCTVQVVFTPNTLGAKAAELQISSNDLDTPILHVPLSGNGIYPTLTVTKTGTGVGTVTSSPAGISCGATCSTTFPTSTNVTLTAAPGADSSFAGWSGGGCSGTAPCPLQLNATTTVTATFNMLPPTCDFYASPMAGGAPLNVSFTDLSHRASVWQWNFGDGSPTNTTQNPNHTYLNLGNFTVTLTTTNVTGPCPTPKQIEIDVRPVRIARLTPVYFNTITEAYAAAVDGETIQCMAVSLTENLNFNLNKSVTLAGGYDPGFTGSTGVTTVHGTMDITAGSVSVLDIDLE